LVPCVKDKKNVSWIALLEHKKLSLYTNHKNCLIFPYFLVFPLFFFVLFSSPLINNNIKQTTMSKRTKKNTTGMISDVTFLLVVLSLVFCFP
jgi:hypothetical protein